MIVRSSGGVAGSITWGVVMLNLINTAFLYKDLTQDGDFSTKDIGKVTYGKELMAKYLAFLHEVLPPSAEYIEKASNWK
ncbi:hypothetical protein [Pseudomonas syringae]|uniref:hypothetical protein n=1 Tax=Pseudomonas syringae TaxID=317 RepID=UPI000466EBA4|nr:hypothetical protein [Pseudomonas syringae]